MGTSLRPVATHPFELGEEDHHHLETRLVALATDALPLGEQQAARFGDATGADQAGGQHRGRRIATRVELKSSTRLQGTLEVQHWVAGQSLQDLKICRSREGAGEQRRVGRLLGQGERLTSQRQRLVKAIPVALPHLAAQQSGCPATRIVAGVDQGALDEGQLRDVTVRVPFHQARQRQGHVGPERPAGQRSGDRLEERSQTAQFAGLAEDRCGLDRPLRPTVEIALRQAADRGGIQVSRRGGRAAGSRRRGCGMEKLGDLRIGVRASLREMVCPGFNVGRNLGQAQMPLPPFVHARLRVGSCGEQRVSERDASLRHPD